jgi:hypothetical protein
MCRWEFRFSHGKRLRARKESSCDATEEFQPVLRSVRQPTDRVYRESAFAKVNDEMRREIIERRNIKAQLLEIEAALYSTLLPAADRTRGKLSDAKPAYEQMLGGISPIGEASPVATRLSSE